MASRPWRRGPIDIIFPRGQHVDVGPLLYGVPNRISGFESERRLAACKKVRDSCESNWASANYGDRQIRTDHGRLRKLRYFHKYRNIEGLRQCQSMVSGLPKFRSA